MPTSVQASLYSSRVEFAVILKRLSELMDYAFAAGFRRMHHEYTRSMKEPMEAGKCRVLFVSEAVTLAHVARPLALRKHSIDRDMTSHWPAIHDTTSYWKPHSSSSCQFSLYRVSNSYVRSLAAAASTVRLFWRAIFRKTRKP